MTMKLSRGDKSVSPGTKQSYAMSRITRTGSALLLAVGMVILVGSALGLGSEAQAATAEEPGFSVPAVNYRGIKQPLQIPSQAGMPATVADFLSQKGWATETIDSLRVKSEVATRKAGKVVILDQEVDGLTVYGSRFKAVFNDNGNLLSLGGNMVAVTGPVLLPQIVTRDALDRAMAAVHPNVYVSLAEIDRINNTVIYGRDSFFYTGPKVTNVAVPMHGGLLAEGFLVEIWSEEDNQLHHVLVSGNGQVLEVQNRTADTHDSYQVFLENPDLNLQIPVSGPEDITTPANEPSPDGWIDPDTGVIQYETNILGNNVNAYLDQDNNNSPDLGGIIMDLPLDFNAIADLSVDPNNMDNPAVAVQNLFYLNNDIHDVLYRHGFTESAGNFQEINFGRGGSDSDSVNAEAQDGGGTNNANFATPGDGSNPRMQMYLWNQSTPRRDGSLDGDIVWHEYGHGLTWRMIGNMTGVMGGALGEGWSDTFATIRYNDDAVGEYSYNDSKGIRSLRYGDYDPAVRNYESITGNSVHFDGEIFAAITWDMWTRYRDDTSGATGGDIDARRNIIMDDFVEGMKFTDYQCSRPTFPSVRDGILEAISGSSDPLVAPSTSDSSGLARWCHTWEAFAKFGVGVDQSTTCRKRGRIIRWEWFGGLALPAACASSGTGSDVGPITDSNSSANQVAENASVGDPVGITAFADDTDGDVVSYSLTDNAGGLFAIDASSGVISVDAALDAETATSHVVTAMAASTDGSTSSKGFTIDVTDVDEFDVVSIADADDSDNEVVENALAGVPVGITALAEDLDVSDDITYSLTANEGEFFAIDASSGVITVNAPLGSDAISSYSVTVEAVSTDTSTSQADFTITEVAAAAVTLTGSSSNQGRMWSAYMTVDVTGDIGVGGSIISGQASDGSCLSGCSCTTDSNGQCTLDSTSILKKNGSIDFTLDSDGSSITILKP